MIVVNLIASPFFGGPERQMLGLARSLPPCYKSVFLSFPERGLCQPFLAALRQDGFEALALKENAPRYVAAVLEIAGILRDFHADILLCHGYKPDLLGLIAARQVGIPVVSVSRGWTGETFKVRVNEALDRLSLFFMDAIVCVSKGQSDKARRLGIPLARLAVIRNAISIDRFAKVDTAYRDILQGIFEEPRSRIVGAAGRLSPEKGFADLVAAAARVIREDPRIGFVIFGEGRLREELAQQIAKLGLTGKVLLPGFRDDLDNYIPALDLLVQSSYTEGLPNIVLESLAASVPVVATAVGGTPEVVQDGVSGYLVLPGKPDVLAERILRVLLSADSGCSMGEQGREYVRTHFSFATQAIEYQCLFNALITEHFPLSRD
jgi:glycosyltransferase involved in cell wall biosynthesis